MIIMLFGDKLCQHGQREGSDAVELKELKRESIEEVHKNVSVYYVLYNNTSNSRILIGSRL